MSAVLQSTELDAHPIAQLFPMLTNGDYAKFKADIAERGLIEPIWLYEGKILDGRNRYRACNELAIEPRFREYEGDTPVAFVWSLNGARRQLTKSQLAVIAVKMLEPLKVEAKKRQQFHGGTAPGITSTGSGGSESISAGEAVRQAATLVGVGKTVVQEAKALAGSDPDLLKEVELGNMSVDKARKIARSTYRPPDPNAPRQPREMRAADIRRLVESGHRADQIAHELKIGEQQVRNIARAESIELPDAKIGKVARINANRVIEETVNGLSGYAIGLKTIDLSQLFVDARDAAEWTSSINEFLKAINAVRKRLSEIANG